MRDGAPAPTAVDLSFGVGIIPSFWTQLTNLFFKNDCLLPMGVMAMMMTAKTFDNDPSHLITNPSDYALTQKCRVGGS